MCKYWIFACAGLFLFISLQEAVVFRLIYMTMFLYFVITFQVHPWLSSYLDDDDGDDDDDDDDDDDYNDDQWSL